jgi:flagellar basal body-associated protein FliL
MQSFLLLVGAAEAAQTKTETVSDSTVGLVLVLVLLALLAITIFALFVFKVPAKAAPATSTAAPANAGIPEAHAKVIAAAALHSALEDNRLLPVILAAAAQAVCTRASSLQLAPSDFSWSNEGRRAIFASHVLSRK